MPLIEDEKKKVEVNEEGFLVNPQEWDEKVAQILAKKEEGIDNLTEDHWAVINYIRNYYLEKNWLPWSARSVKLRAFN